MAIRSSFFGKNCVIDKPLKDRSNLLAMLEKRGYNKDNVLLLNQIHGHEVVVIDDVSKIYGEQGLPKADAIVTNLKNVVIGVVTADCAPILLQDDRKNIIAAVHAGWKGAKSGVVAAAVAAMKNLGAENIKAKIGAMIQQDSYQVGQEFYDDFVNEDEENKGFFIAADEAGRYNFNLPSYVEKKLKAAGINEIDNRHTDTYKNENEFFSYRRAAHQGVEDCGRNVSVIMID